MNGHVVQAIRGERSSYLPVKSILTSETKPLPVAQALLLETGCKEFYIADLDALQGRGDHGNEIRTLANDLGAELWVDMGVTNPDSALKALELGDIHIILGSESLQDMQDLQQIQKIVPQERLLFSVDIVKGRVISKSSVLKDLDPLAAIDMLSQKGLQRFILLTLDRVGTGGGLDLPLLKAVRDRFPDASLIAGGGARKLDDIKSLATLGIDGALVATALHRGWITGQDLESCGLNR